MTDCCMTDFYVNKGSNGAACCDKTVLVNGNQNYVPADTNEPNLIHMKSANDYSNGYVGKSVINGKT